MTQPINERLDEPLRSSDEEVVEDYDDGGLNRTVEDVYGIIPALPNRETGDFDDLIEEAMEAHADRFVARMRQQGLK